MPTVQSSSPVAISHFQETLSPIRRPGMSALELHWRRCGFTYYPAAPVTQLRFWSQADCPNCGLVGTLELRPFIRTLDGETSTRSLIICRTCLHNEATDCGGH